MSGFRAPSLALISLFLSSAPLNSYALQNENSRVPLIRDQIVAAYQRAVDALRRGDAESALQMDTEDWTSVVVGQPTRSKQEMAPLIRRDIAGMRPPDAWNVVWLPNYEHNGTVTGIQLYDLNVDGSTATVLCLVGTTHDDNIGAERHSVWIGSHVRDSWTLTTAGWKRQKHEKLTINEQMVDGSPIR